MKMMKSWWRWWRYDEDVEEWFNKNLDEREYE